MSSGFGGGVEGPVLVRGDELKTHVEKKLNIPGKGTETASVKVECTWESPLSFSRIRRAYIIVIVNTRPNRSPIAMDTVQM